VTLQFFCPAWLSCWTDHIALHVLAASVLPLADHKVLVLHVVCCCSFLQRLDDFRSWAQLGFLACPSALQGVNAQNLLSALLRDSFLLPVYGDVVLPLHSMFQHHVTPALEQLVNLLLDSSANKATKQQQLLEARQLVGRCYQAAVDSAEAEHAARRRYICRVLQDMLACLEVRAVGSTQLQT
jgi:hypothetical protein